MKKLLILLFAFALIVISNTATAQRTNMVNRNGDERFGYNVTTTGATATYIDSFIIHNNEGGIFESTVIGYAKDTALCVTGKIHVRFNKHRGILTMGTPVADYDIVTDTALGASTFAYVAANNKIYIQVTGKAATNIVWTSITKRKTVWYIN